MRRRPAEFDLDLSSSVVGRRPSTIGATAPVFIVFTSAVSYRRAVTSSSLRHVRLPGPCGRHRGPGNGRRRRVLLVALAVPLATAGGIAVDALSLPGDDSPPAKLAE